MTSSPWFPSLRSPDPVWQVQLAILSDGDAEESFHSLQDAVAGVVEKPYLDGLNTSINEFDFDTAPLKLDEIAEHCVRNGDGK